MHVTTPWPVSFSDVLMKTCRSFSFDFLQFFLTLSRQFLTYFKYLFFQNDELLRIFSENFCFLLPPRMHKRCQHRSCTDWLMKKIDENYKIIFISFKNISQLIISDKHGSVGSSFLYCLLYLVSLEKTESKLLRRILLI